MTVELIPTPFILLLSKRFQNHPPRLCLLLASILGFLCVIPHHHSCHHLHFCTLHATSARHLLSMLHSLAVSPPIE